jgi:hypothetical protein
MVALGGTAPNQAKPGRHRWQDHYGCCPVPGCVPEWGTCLKCGCLRVWKDDGVGGGLIPYHKFPDSEPIKGEKTPPCPGRRGQP